MAVDAGALAVGFALAQVARYDVDPGRLRDSALWVLAAFAICLQYFVGTALHLYLGRYRFGGFDEVLILVKVTSITSGGALLADLLAGPARPVAASVPVLGGVIALVLMCGVRYAWRLMYEASRRPDPQTTEPLLVFGAGEGGSGVVTALLRDPASPYRPVALFDDDPGKHNLSVSGVRVRGDRGAIASVARATGAATLLIAVPTADTALLREVTGLAEAAALTVKVLPPVGDLGHRRVGVGDIRDIDLVDMLGRHQVDTDVASVAGCVAGKRVLVTGAGGSIGSELCKQLHRYAPAELIMLDRDESALHAVQLSLTGRALLDTADVVLADIRDAGQLRRVFNDRRPQVVFHAAALKHLPMLEQYPGESVKTNVWGTLAVLEAAAAAGVERFVNISTDKAADPVSVLGYSKRVAERLTAHVAGAAEGSFLSVRFGNVLGSRGSVLTTFAAQIAGGGPVTITDRDVTRYFMTVQEAVQLVIQAAAIGRPGEALVLDMGEPVRIAEVAERLLARAPRQVQIIYTGLRVGEKLHEDLLGADEVDHRPVHPLVSHVRVPPLRPAAALALDPWSSPAAVREELRQLSYTNNQRADLVAQGVA